ncbi:MAG: phosphopentomutase [Anaerolineaceae bacterium]|jgi:phosphopentomutase|nr:MAG: phosphopentomutase [Anaerolineaceae bacterium]
MEINRIAVIVLDGVGAGELPDAGDYGDAGSNSLSNTARVLGGLNLPNMGEIGLGNITPIPGVPPREKTRGAYGKCREASKGKDSVTGHWELMGIEVKKPFPTYPNGFPKEVLDEFSRLTGYEVLGNKPASGTEILKELGEEHVRTRKPIVYTSADSVFQIAAHEDVIPIEELYRLCAIAREMLKGDHAVGRVIARPFRGDSAETFARTKQRHDYPLLAPTDTMLDTLIKAGHKVYATGKIDDLFGNRGISKTHHSVFNMESIQALVDFMDEDFTGLLFANLVEFDMTYGHRNDVEGYGQKLEEFDAYIPTIRQKMQDTDIAMIVADHGVDPTTESTDHSREYIPLLVFGKQVKNNINLGIRQSFADVAATIGEAFSVTPPKIGTSFLKEILPDSM